MVLSDGKCGLRQFPNIPRQLKSFRRSEHDRSVSSGITSSVQNEEFDASSDWHLVSFVWGVRQRVWGKLHWRARDVVCRTATGDSLTGTRTEFASASELSAFKPGSVLLC